MMEVAGAHLARKLADLLLNAKADLEDSAMDKEDVHRTYSSLRTHS